MKNIMFTILLLSCIGGFAQSSTKTRSKGQKKVANKVSSTPLQPGRPVHNLAPGQTVTDLYLNGPRRSGTDTTTKDTSAFAKGVHAAPDAAKPLDAPATPTAGLDDNTSHAPFRNDTTYNSNTVLANGQLSNSGAVDRSGQTQFGKNNWGDSRGTVGESQWTIPPPVSSAFSKEFPQAGQATWSRSDTDSLLYSARYRSGDYWISSNYNNAGQRLDQRTEYTIIQSPPEIRTYIQKQVAPFRVAHIYKLQVQGKPDVYELRTQGGRTVYLGMDGNTVEY